MKPIVSIITPTYNHEKFISLCIKSVINQRFQDWEMVILDDSSIDRTYKIAYRSAETDKRIKIIRHKNNWGIGNLSKTYNQGLELSQGKYIAILEGDDFWPKYKLERQLTDFKDKNTVLSYGDCAITNAEGTTLKIETYHKFTNKPLDSSPLDPILALFLELEFYLMSPTIMIRKDLLIKRGGFQKDKVYPFIDIPTYLNLSQEGKFYYHNDILGFYRKHEGSAWFNHAKKTEAMLRDEIKECVFQFIHKRHGENLVNSYALKKNIVRSENILLSKHTNKPLTLLYHYLVFDDKENIYKTSKKILSSKVNNLIKLITLLVLIFLPVNEHLLFLMSYIRTAFYYFKRLFQINR